MKAHIVCTLNLLLLLPHVSYSQLSDRLQDLTQSLQALEKQLMPTVFIPPFFEGPNKDIMWDKEIIQLPVLNQFAGPAYGGGASCGYQALKNAMYVPRIIYGKAMLDDLLSLPLVQQLFNKEDPIGKWRILLLQNLYRRAIKWVIDEKLLSLLYNPKDKENIPLPPQVQQLRSDLQDRFREKIRGFYQSVLTDIFSPTLVAKIMDEIHANTMQSKPNVRERRRVYRKPLERKEIIEAIKNAKKTISSDIPGLEAFDFQTYVKSDDTIAQYLPLMQDKIEFSTYNWVENNYKLRKGIAQLRAIYSYNLGNLLNQFDYDADWIKENQIHQLIEYEKQPNGLFADLPQSFDGVTVIENVQLLDDPEGFGEVAHIREIAARYARSDTFVHAFVVGLMAGIPGYPQGEEHWITLVLNKQQGRTQYIVTDSGANANRLKDPIVGNLIKHLEGKA